MAAGHRPVMLEETIDAGGHSRAILGRLGPEGRLVGIDRDPEAAGRASDLLEDPRFEFVSGAYDGALWAMVERGRKVDAVLFDLGLSSFQVDDPERGFSYVRGGPLDMRMDPSSGVSAAQYLDTVETEELVRVLFRYGDVPRGEARRVAREIARRRPLQTTTDLYEAVRAAVGWKERGGNPANRVFQAVRVVVNDELGSLARALEASEQLLIAGGRLVVITFHSGEDRLVKRFISEREGRCVCPPELPVCVCGA